MKGMAEEQKGTKKERKFTKQEMKLQKEAKERENVEKMKTLISMARTRPNKRLYQTVNDQMRLEFNHKIMMQYLQHTKLATDIMYNPNAMTFTSSNEKGIHIWNPETGESLFQVNLEIGSSADKFEASSQQTHVKRRHKRGEPEEDKVPKIEEKKKVNLSGQQISCICYSKRFYLYFACTKMFRCIVFNEYLNVVGEIPLNIRLVQKCYFLDESEQLITAGVAGCFIVQLKIDYSYPPKQAIMLNPKGDSVSVEVVKPQPKIDNLDLKSFQKIEPIKNLYNEYYYKFEKMGQWVQGSMLDLKSGFFVCWNNFKFSKNDNRSAANLEEMEKNGPELGAVKKKQSTCNFYRFDPKASPEKNTSNPIVCEDLTTLEDYITDMIMYKEMMYFAFSTFYGNINVYKWMDISQGEKQFMHTFNSHSRAITSMRMVGNGSSNFVSTSLDGSVRMWCLDKLIELYCFEIDQSDKGESMAQHITNIQLIDDQNFAIFSKGYQSKIEIGQISHLAHSFFISMANISNVTKGFHNFYRRNMNECECLIITFDNNSILLLDPTNGQVKSTIYPPPTPTNIQKVIYCMVLKRVFVLLETGTICVYKVHKRETATLEKIQFPKQLKDYEGKSLTQSITCLTSGSNEPPMMDSEIFNEGAIKGNSNDKKSKKAKHRERSRARKYEQVLSSSGDELSDDLGFDSDSDYEDTDRARPNDNFLIMGLSKGSVIFVKVQDIESIYARFSVHRQEILHLKEMKKQKLYISICSENVMNIWGFVDDERDTTKKRLQIWKSCKIYRPLKYLTIMEDPAVLILNFPAGDSVCLQWIDEKKDLVLVPTDRSVEHDESVAQFDIHHGMKLVVSADQDGLIKVWNFMKELVREIKFTEPISAVCFLNAQADLLVAHKGKLSRIHARSYLPHSSMYAFKDANDVVTRLDESRSQAQKLAIESENLAREAKKLHIGKSRSSFLSLENLMQQDLSALFYQLKEDALDEARLDELHDPHTRTAELLRKTKDSAIPIMAPKFGMEMDEFKASLPRDDRVPALKDKRIVEAIHKAKLAADHRQAQTVETFDKSAMHLALHDATREQQRILNANSHQRKQISPQKLKSFSKHNLPTIQGDKAATQITANVKVNMSEDPLTSSQTSMAAMQQKRPGATRALPITVSDPVRPGGNGYGFRNGPPRTRYQKTLDKICDNVQRYADPAGPKQSLPQQTGLVGIRLECQSVYSERRAVSRGQHSRAQLGAMGVNMGVQGSIDYENPASELNQKVNFISASNGYLMEEATNGMSSGNLGVPPAAYQNTLHTMGDSVKTLRKNLLSANIYARRGKAARMSSRGDFSSQPEFSLGTGSRPVHNISGTPTASQSIRGMQRTVKTASSLRPFAMIGGPSKNFTNRQHHGGHGSRIFTTHKNKIIGSYSGRMRNLALTNVGTMQEKNNIYSAEMAQPLLPEKFSGTVGSYEKGRMSFAETGSGTYSASSRARPNQASYGFPARKPLQSNIKVKM